MTKLEQACMALLRATDSRGRLVRIHTGPNTVEGFRASLVKLSEFRRDDTGPAAQALRRNQKLLVNCIKAASDSSHQSS